CCFCRSSRLARNQVQYQKDLSEDSFVELYGTEEQCHAALVNAFRRHPDASSRGQQNRIRRPLHVPIRGSIFRRRRSTSSASPPARAATGGWRACIGCSTSS